MHDARTRYLSTTRATSARGVRAPRAPRRLRVPITTAAISLVILMSPSLALAPLHAIGPGAAAPWHVEPLTDVPPDTDGRTAGGMLPPPSSVLHPWHFHAALDAALDAALATTEADGATFAVVRNGKLVWTGASGRGLHGPAALSAGEPLIIGSLTKTYVAAAVLQLVEEGTLALEDSVANHLPGLSGLSSDISIRHLLDHSSGLADLYNETTRRSLDEQPGHTWGAAEMLGALHEPTHEPGEGWSYANTNYYLLGLVVEKVTGVTLADELQRRFLAPLGLGTTRMLAGADMIEQAWTSLFWASGTMTASATDVARWGDALYRGSVLTDASLDAMTTVNDHDYGLGLQRIEVAGVEGYGHSGLLHNYTALLFHLPDEGVTLSLLVNRSRVELGEMLTAEPGRGRPSLLELAREAGS